MKEAFKEGKGIQGGKMHSKREEAFCAGNYKQVHTQTIYIHELWFNIFSSPLLEEAFKEGKGIQGGKRHSRREEAFWEGNLNRT